GGVRPCPGALPRNSRSPRGDLLSFRSGRIGLIARESEDSRSRVYAEFRAGQALRVPRRGVPRALRFGAGRLRAGLGSGQKSLPGLWPVLHAAPPTAEPSLAGARHPAPQRRDPATVKTTPCPTPK